METVMNDVAILYQSARAKHRNGDVAGAETDYRAVIDFDPRHADAHANLGFLFLLKNDLAGADREIRTALGLQPDHADALKSLAELRLRQGNRWAMQEHYNKANRAFHHAASLPDGKELWRWKSLGFCPTVFQNEFSVNRYWQRLHEGLDNALAANVPVDWRTILSDGFTPSFNLPHLGKCCREIKEKFARFFEKAFPHERPSFEIVRKHRTKIRLGFVVTAGHHRGFFRAHLHLLQHLDLKKFDVYVICPAPIVPECRRTVYRDGVVFIGLPRDFLHAAETLRKTQCDLLYHWKVGGGALDYFLPFLNAAPIQCVSYGSHGTSGVGLVDYFISTAQLESPSAQASYTERLVLLDSYATSHPREGRTVVRRAELDLPEQGAIYFCAQRLPKYHPCFDAYLKRILEKDSNGNMILLTGKHPPLKELFSQRLQHNLGDALFKRVRLVAHLPLNEYKKYVAASTCLLDSPVYAGDLTTHDAFENGVPVVTQNGELLVQRYTSGLCSLMGLDELVANNLEEYSDVAVRLGTDSDYRDDIHRKILERNDVVFAPDATLRDYESFFEKTCSRT